MEGSKILSIREELENELTWRTNELKILKNQLIKIPKPEDRDIYRKSLVVMLYAHYEGFCNFAFQTYVIAINEENLLRKDVNSNLAAASMHQEFSLFEQDEYNENRFKKVFGKKPPEDNKLFKFSKRVYLYEAFDDFLNQKIEIPDKIVNTESNLWPVVLKKLLYSLGLPESTFARHETSIKNLVSTRNGISHGQKKDGISEVTFEELEKSTNEINNSIIKLIYNSLINKEYLNQNINDL
ncbi:MAE_28990/MAE_18760 family HEPN-like nuclease [Gottfriedia sp. NPDC056225]|uniref:MAE_28990/MAE_18760 family HEPN-like nuclease n=1 Tax=Gottfriedia sp. NPDC056225 TaxID=3345751 RepID=UPI0035DEA3C5